LKEYEEVKQTSRELSGEREKRLGEIKKQEKALEKELGRRCKVAGFNDKIRKFQLDEVDRIETARKEANKIGENERRREGELTLLLQKLYQERVAQIKKIQEEL
jgi:hypothetical protein